MAFRSIGTATTTPTTSPSLSAPGSIVAGDILVAALSSDSTGTTVTAPSGWDALSGTPVTATFDGARLFVFTKVATGSEPSSYSFTTSTSVVGAIAAFSQRHATSYLHRSSTNVVASPGGTSPSTAAYSSATTEECDELWIGAPDDGDIATSWTPPTGFTERADFSGTGNNFYGLTIATRDAQAAGAGGNYTGSRTGFGGSSCMVALALAVGDTSTVEQTAYRWYDDDGDEDGSTAAGAENTAITAPASAAKHLRLQIDATGNPSSYPYQLEVKKSSDSTWRAVAASQPTATISYGASGAISAPAAGGTAPTPAFPTGITTRSALVLVVGQKPATANGGTVTTPTGWTLAGSVLAQGGYGATLGADTGNTNLFFYTKDTVTGSESGTQSVTVGDTNAAWAQIHRFEASADVGSWSVALATGSDASAGNVSVTFGSNPGVQAGDAVLVGLCIPTDVTTPAQFSAHALSQTGITFGTVTEISEPDSGTGNDIGGVMAYATVSSGTASAAPQWTATAGGTTTNVRGPAGFLRLRATPTLLPALLAASSHIGAGGTTATTARLTPPATKDGSSFDPGAISDDTNPLPTLDLASDHWSELVWCVQPVASEVTDGDVLQFRPTQNGTALAGYDQTASLTIGSGITGAATLALAPSLTAAGTVAIVGSASLTLAPTLAATGTVGAPVTGDASLTLAPSLTAAGTVAVVGSAALPLAPTLTATATAAVVGAASLTLAPTVSATGTVAVAGAAALALAPSLTAAGTVAIVGSAALTLAPSLAATAVSGTTATGAAALTLAPTVTAAGTVLVAGACAIPLAPALAATGVVAVTGSATLAPSAPTVTATGTVTVSGAASLTLATTVTANALVGTAPFVGSVAGTLRHGPTVLGTLTHGPLLAATLAHGPAVAATLTLSPGTTMLDLSSTNFVDAASLTNARTGAALSSGQVASYTVNIYLATNLTTAVAAKAGTVESATRCYAEFAPADLTSLIDGETYSLEHVFTMNSGAVVRLWDHGVTAGRYEPAENQG